MRIQVLVGMLAVSTVLVGAQAPARNLSPAANTLQAGSRLNAELKSKLDTKHAKVGDRVSAVTTSDFKQNGIKVLPKGSTLTGHVTEVTRAKNGSSPSRIGVLFDHAITKRGQPVALHAGIASVLQSGFGAAGMHGGANGMGGMDAMSGMGAMPAPAMGGGGGLGGAVGGLGATAGAAGGAVLGAAGAGGQVLASGAGQVPGAAGRLGGTAVLASNGAPLQIQMPVANSAAGESSSSLGSVLSTRHGNLQLDNGTRVVLQNFSSPASDNAAGAGSAVGTAALGSAGKAAGNVSGNASASGSAAHRPPVKANAGASAHANAQAHAH